MTEETIAPEEDPAVSLATAEEICEEQDVNAVLTPVSQEAPEAERVEISDEEGTSAARLEPLFVNENHRKKNMGCYRFGKPQKDVSRRTADPSAEADRSTTAESDQVSMRFVIFRYGGAIFRSLK